MAKKNTSATRATESTTAESTSSAAPKRRRAPARRTTDITPSIADDRETAMPEPAGQRVTPTDVSTADSVNFPGLEAAPTYQQIAEAAYHRYLSRGGSDGQDFEDWIEAERLLRVR